MEEGEDGYTALRFKGRRKRSNGTSSRSSPFGHPFTISLGVAVTILLGTVTGLTVLKHAQCEYCPLGWVLHHGKCYYFSEKKKNWSDSKWYCSSQAASLAVIDNEEEKTFIMNRMKMEKGYYWVGLSKGKDGWLWVTGAGLPAEKLHVTGSSDSHSCVVCGVDEILAESCFNPNKWVCEKATMEFPTVERVSLN
ncbi:C-type lectin domain family 2 member B-like isoform X2 [Caretta caretta]|uniref:C-type lectin domain family 2 member B-like isoform X2 n=1 Tax=Caretta caretta TaxID=8467 RepID=UPI002095CAB3|nr:C-type lectin domain family 2 member B-like isoform X2 [Caretta caretta]